MSKVSDIAAIYARYSFQVARVEAELRAAESAAQETLDEAAAHYCKHAVGDEIDRTGAHYNAGMWKVVRVEGRMGLQGLAVYCTLAKIKADGQLGKRPFEMHGGIFEWPPTGSEERP